MDKESVRKDSRKVGSGRLDFTLSRFQKSGLTSFWVTLLPLVQQVPHHHRAGPRSLLPPQACPLVDGLVTLLSSWGWLRGLILFLLRSNF